MNPPDALSFFDGATFNSPVALGTSVLTGNIITDMDAMQLSYSKEGYLFLGCAYISAYAPRVGIPTPTVRDTHDKVVITAFMGRDYVRPHDNQTPPTYTYTPETGEKPTNVPRGKSEDQYGDFCLATIGNIPDPEAAGILRTVVGSINDMKGHFINLLAAYQVKPLKASQVVSYWASVNVFDIQGTIFASKFGELIVGFPKISNSSAGRDRLIKSAWIDYRLTFASSVNLLRKMMVECPAEYKAIFSDETSAQITRAYNAPWDSDAYRAIPVKALAVLYAWQKALAEIPDNFHGPKRAYDSLATNERKSLDAWFGAAVKKIKVYDSGLGAAIIGDRVNYMPDSLKEI